MATTSPRSKTAAPTPTVASALPPFLTFLIISRYLQDALGRDRLRALLAHPSAPKPLIGGSQGSTPIWSRDAIVAFFDRVSREGWPVGGAQ